MERYTRTAILLHWLIALLILAAFSLGLAVAAMPGLSPTKLRYVSYHKWLGVSIFLLACLRLAWRLFHPAPPLPAAIGSAERRLAGLVQGLLYLLLLLIPASGYFHSLAAGVPVHYLGLIPLPVLIAPNPVLKPVLRELHFWLNMLLAAALALHIAGTIKHFLYDKNNLLRRMLP